MSKYNLRIVTKNMVLGVDQTGFPALTAIEAGMAMVMLEGYVVDVLRGMKTIINLEPDKTKRGSIKMHPIANDLDQFEELAISLAGKDWRKKNG